MEPEQPLHTVSAGGFSVTADAFVLDEDDGLWFVSLVGSQGAVKAVIASLLKRPPEAAWITRGSSSGYRRCFVAPETIGTWTTRLKKLPATNVVHGVAYTRIAEFSFEREEFLLLVRGGDDVAQLHRRFLDRRIDLPLHSSWARWLWERALQTAEAEPLESVGLEAYRCRPNVEALRSHISAAISSGRLTVPDEKHCGGNGHRASRIAAVS